MKVLALLVLVGCAPLAGAGRARVMPAHANEVTVTPEVMLITPRLSSTDVHLPWAQIAIGYRRGFMDRVELGARVWGFSLGKTSLKSSGAAFDGKVQLMYRDRGGPFDLALAPSAGYHKVEFGGTPEHQALFSLPLLFGFQLGPNQLVLGPRVAYQLWFGESQQTQRILFGGLSLAFAWRLGAHFTLTPELVMLYAPVPFGGEDPGTSKKGLTLTSVGIGFTWGW